MRNKILNLIITYIQVRILILIIIRNSSYMPQTTEYGFYIDKTLKKLQSIYLQTFKKNAIDLTIEQWAILHRIYQLGENGSQSEITKTNYRNRATTSRVISKLVQKGMVLKERFDGDGKRFKLTVTDNGKQLIERVEPLIINLRNVGVTEIGRQEFSTFISVLDKIWINYNSFEKL